MFPHGSDSILREYGDADGFERGSLDQVLQQAGFVSARKPPERFQHPTRANWLTVPVALLAREHQPARAYPLA
jgi:hypothetical protein